MYWTMNSPSKYDSNLLIIHNLYLGKNVRFVKYGAIQVLRNADGCGGGGLWFSGKKHYEGVIFNVISVTRGWVGVQFPKK